MDFPLLIPNEQRYRLSLNVPLRPKEILWQNLTDNRDSLKHCHKNFKHHLFSYELEPWHAFPLVHYKHKDVPHIKKANRSSKSL